MTVSVEFFFDLSSPWTRLAFHNLAPTLAGTDSAVTLRPLLVGGVFNAVNSSVYAARVDAESRKMAMSFHWLRQWAELAGVAMNFPSSHHPLRSVSAMRMCCALEPDQEALGRFAEAAFEAYFNHQRNLDDPAELVAVADACSFDGAALAKQASGDAIKARLRANTDEAIARGAFGSPTLFVGGEHMYFGNDQLPLVRQRVEQLAGQA